MQLAEQATRRAHRSSEEARAVPQARAGAAQRVGQAARARTPRPEIRIRWPWLEWLRRSTTTCTSWTAS